MSYKTDLLKLEDAYFHVYNRGVGRGAIFFSERNYRYFITRLQKYRAQFQITILAYCLMPNHFHLLIRQNVPKTVSGFMKLTTNSYSKAVNKSLKRSGRLFEGKYRIKHIKTDAYLVHLSRYIHLNPVKAGLADKPEAWSFSSFRHYIQKSRSSLIEPNLILNQFSSTEEYIDFVHEVKAQDSDLIKDLLLD